MTISSAKRDAFAFLDRNAPALATLSDSIFYFGELGLQEYETAGLMCSHLEEAGFRVQRGLSGFETAFLATFGDEGPTIALHTEYDANPENSQVSGVAERAEITPGAPGHCEGHNVNGAVLVASAIAIKKAMEAHGLKGRLKVFGAPAEEQILSRPYFVRDGHFDDVDAAFHNHIAGEFKAIHGVTHVALISAIFRFHGESVHASTAPWRGRDALDAVMMMDAGMAQHREHMRPEMRAHRVVLEGGHQPNVIPARASLWWYFRDPTAEGVRALFEKARRVAEGAALMTNTQLEVETLSAVWPVRANETLAHVLQANIEAIGMPAWNAEEQALARKLQEAAQVEAVGLLDAPTPLRGPSPQRAPSNDCGDISWKTPMGRLSFPATAPNLPFHHWSAGAPLATSIAHKGALAGAKALAGAVIDLFEKPTLIEDARRTFAREIGDVRYAPLLPADQKAPAAMNREGMERFRPAMRAHYVKQRAPFV
ncbi:MAG: amidohydrolase [Beijerinckiaceae bacterium]